MLPAGPLSLGPLLALGQWAVDARRGKEQRQATGHDQIDTPLHVLDDVAIQPGGSPDMFKNGDEVVLTQSSMQLEELIGKYLVGGDAGKGGDKAGEKPAAKPDGK